MRSLDFGTHSDTAKYDIWQVFLGYICALSPTKSSIIPLSKHQMTIAKVKSKVAKMAEDRNMCVKELMLCAILKTLITRKEPKSKINAVKCILNKSFSPGVKVFRLAHTQRPDNFTPSKMFIDNFNEGDRMIKLNRRMGFQLFDKDKERIKLLGDWTDIKKSIDIYAIPTIKTYLKKHRVLY